jgi:hypothetical protein
LIVALVALVAALAGSAVALPGKNSVDKNDIKKNAVKSKAIKNGQVKAADVADGSIGAAEIADGSVGAAELADPEALHIVGAAGEPTFANGSEGDCIWKSITTLGGPAATFQEPAFYMDSDGRVHLAGTAVREDAAGGDGECGGGSGEGDEDSIAFILPPAYRPAKGEFFFMDDAGDLSAAVVAVDIDLGSGVIPGGAVVLATDQDLTSAQGALSGISFRAATPAVARANAERAPVHASGSLLNLLR